MVGGACGAVDPVTNLFVEGGVAGAYIGEGGVDDAVGGDESGGGGGVPVSFELPNGWKFRISATRTYLPDGYNIEKGIEPDIYQTTGPAEELQGIDAIIEKGREVILEKAAAVDEK